MADVIDLLTQRFPSLESKFRSEIFGLLTSDPRVLRDWLLDNRLGNWQELVNQNSFDPLKITKRLGSLDVYGDSVVGIGGDSAPSDYNVASVAAQLVATSRDLSEVHNQAVSGSLSSEMAAQLANSTLANFALIHAGTNDAASDVPVSTYMANVRAVGQTLKSVGTTVFLCVPIARDDVGFTLAMQTRFEEYKEALLNEPRGLYWDELIRTDLVDEWSLGRVSVNASERLGGDANAGVHPPPKASFYIAQKIKQTLTPYISPLYRVSEDSPFSGSGGLISGSGLSGSLPDDWVGVGALSGASLTLSGSPFQVSGSGTATGPGEFALLVGPAQAKTLGDSLRARMVISTSGDLSAFCGFSIAVYRETGGSVIAQSLGVLDPTNSFSDLWPNMSEVEFFSPIVSAPATDSYRVCLVPYARQSATLSGTVTIHEATLQEYDL